MKLPTKIERLEAELKYAKLTEKHLATKAAGKLTKKMKDDYREATQDWRDNYRQPTGAGAQPATVSAKASKS